ncbi:MAG TPA: hypothetical protein VMT39_00570 [Candidatus Bathyarchaeia archaeon]|nr:hypothetical protein [Candidatus Bathyarchaeia archaeon]
MVDPCQRVGYLPHQNGPLLATVDLAGGADCRYAAVTDQFGIEFATLPFQNSPGSLVCGQHVCLETGLKAAAAS